jgi:predicted HNH restriction endonuclease
MLWQAGKEAGIYALGAIACKPYQKKRERLVDILYEQMLGHPVFKTDLKKHRLLRHLSVVKQPRGTVFTVTDEEWQALKKLISNGNPGDEAEPIAGESQDGDQVEFAERRQIAREKEIWARNPQLASDAKKRDSYTCQICSFNFMAAYGRLGKEYAECHHMNPLSERLGAASDPEMTRIEDVITLCANCHRMVHRTQPALSVAAVKADLAKQAEIRGGPYFISPRP